MRTVDPRDHVAALREAGQTVRAVRGERVVFDPAQVTLVVDGWMRVARDAAFVRDVTLALAGPGAMLGAGALFGERSAETCATAITDATLAVFDPAVLRERADSAAFYVWLSQGFAQRTLAVHRKLEAFSRAGVEARVAAGLLDIAAAGGIVQPDGAIRLTLPLSQADLAGLAGTTRESASGAVAGFARAGLVQGGRLRGLLVLDPAGLERAAAG
jgi:CRP-like cAMP-binding protein